MNPAIVPLVALTIIVTGCAPLGGRAETGTRFYVYRTAQGHEVLGVKWQKSGAMAAVVTNDQSDEEFWQFDARVNDGVPYNVIGTREKCEAVRTASPHWASLTDPCRGPYFFKREK